MRHLPTIAGLAVLALPLGFLSAYDLGVLSLVCLFVVAALAQNVLTGYGGVASLGNAAFFGTGAFVTGSLVSAAGAPMFPAAAAGVAAAALLGLVTGLPTLRISGMYLAIVTVALVFVAQELMGNWDQAHLENGVTVNGPAWLLDERSLYLMSAATVFLIYIALHNFLGSRAGRSVQAVSTAPEAAAACGIAPTTTRLGLFVLSGALTGFAGVIYLFYAHAVTPGAFPLDLSLTFLTMVVVGGLRSLPGSVMGGILVALTPQALVSLPFSVGNVSAQGAAPALYAVALLISLNFFPLGLWNPLRTILTERFG